MEEAQFSDIVLRCGLPYGRWYCLWLSSCNVVHVTTHH